MKIIKAGETVSIDFKAEDIVGFNFVAGGTNTVNTSKIIDFSKVQVTGKLFQRNRETTLFSGALQVFLLESNFFSNLWSTIVSNNVTNLATSGTNNYIHPAKFELGGIINLRESDTLSLTVSVDAAAFNSGWTNTFLAVESNVGVGLQYVTPKIDVRSIPANESQIKMPLGNNVTNIAFISDNSNAYVVKNVRLYSDRLNFSKDMNNLLLDRIDQLKGIEATEVVKRYSCFNIVGEELDNCRLEMDLDPTLVAVGKCTVVVRSFEADRSTIELAQIRRAEHDSYDRAKLGM